MERSCFLLWLYCLVRVLGVICLGIYSYKKPENHLPPPVRNAIDHLFIGLSVLAHPAEGLGMILFGINRRADRWAESIS